MGLGVEPPQAGPSGTRTGLYVGSTRTGTVLGLAGGSMAGGPVAALLLVAPVGGWPGLAGGQVYYILPSVR